MNPNVIGRQIAVQKQRESSNAIYSASFDAANFIAKGRFLLAGQGEATLDINFPVNFVKEPTFFFGAILEDNQQVTIGSIPKASCIVISFRTEQKGPSTVLYRGARLGVVVESDLQDLKTWINWHFIGEAISNPIDSTNLAGGI